MFPIVVAREEGLFEKEGVTLEVHDIVPGGQPENKAEWYREALEDRSRDFYFCCAWQGVYSTCETGKGKIGAAIKSTLIKTFGIYTKPDSPIRSILDITENGIQIAVNKNADAHYVTLENLAEFVPASQIKLMHLGGIDGCFKALASGDVRQRPSRDRMLRPPRRLATGGSCPCRGPSRLWSSSTTRSTPPRPTRSSRPSTRR